MDLTPINLLLFIVLILSVIFLAYILYWIIFEDYMPGYIDISKSLPSTPLSQKNYFE